MPRPIKRPILYEDLTYKLIGFAMGIHNELGSIHKEAVYQNAFAQELKTAGIPFKREEVLPVNFKGKEIGSYKPDFVVDEKVVVEIKAVEFLPQKAEVQLSYYLKGTKYRVGLLLNFGSPKLQIKRRIYGW
ncbi:MAG: GxxExxY protein [Patescibacteria group bacterium]